ncbi:hypothetical protein BACSTE_02358 [Bacteroides stercoris ATCC 43183]|uniref:Lipoprotein n=1 Tax=Bacteroides stercoris ATCC 43183 TaxID=449673 RepID=B0NS94_BACSE|nr:hypothetical protein BACSTE_02358 [Bacteroides stercoris ATCC 43183]
MIDKIRGVMKIVKLMTCDSAAVIVSLLSGCRKQPDNRETE